MIRWDFGQELVNTGWTVEKIEQDWLHTSIDALALTPGDVVAAFERVEQYLGLDWMTARKMGWGISPTMEVVRLGQILNGLHEVPNHHSLVNKIGRGETSAEAELAVVHMLRRGDSITEIELYPEVQGRVPDLRARINLGQWIYFEVCRPETSDSQDLLRRDLSGLIDRLLELNRPFTIEVRLNRRPEAAELPTLAAELSQLVEKEDPAVAPLSRNLGSAAVNFGTPGEVTGYAHRQDDFPRIGIIAIKAAPAGGPLYRAEISIPFEDQRVKKLLRREAKQLPSDFPGVVMLDVTNAPGSFESWGTIFQSRLVPLAHSKVSAICLFSQTVGPIQGRYSCFFRTKFILNPHAKQIVPSWVSTAIEAAGADFANSGLEGGHLPGSATLAP